MAQIQIAPTGNYEFVNRNIYRPLKWSTSNGSAIMKPLDSMAALRTKILWGRSPPGEIQIFHLLKSRDTKRICLRPQQMIVTIKVATSKHHLGGFGHWHMKWRDSCSPSELASSAGGAYQEWSCDSAMRRWGNHWNPAIELLFLAPNVSSLSLRSSQRTLLCLR